MVVLPLLYGAGGGGLAGNVDAQSVKKIAQPHHTTCFVETGCNSSMPR